MPINFCTMESWWRNCNWLNRTVPATGYNDGKQDHLACKSSERLQTWRHLMLPKMELKFWLQLEIMCLMLLNKDCWIVKLRKSFRKYNKKLTIKTVDFKKYMVNPRGLIIDWKELKKKKGKHIQGWQETYQRHMKINISQSEGFRSTEGPWRP